MCKCWEREHAPTCTREGWRRMQGLSLKLELDWWPASPREPPTHRAENLGLCIATPGFLVEVGDLNSESHMYNSPLVKFKGEPLQVCGVLCFTLSFLKLFCPRSSFLYILTSEPCLWRLLGSARFCLTAGDNLQSVRWGWSGIVSFESHFFGTQVFNICSAMF